MVKKFGRRSFATLSVQLDYYCPSIQYPFIKNDPSSQSTSTTFSYLPLCPPGDEVEIVKQKWSQGEPTIGVVDQNILTNISGVRAFAAMYQDTPLGIYGTSDFWNSGGTLAVHEDSVDVYEKVLETVNFNRQLLAEHSGHGDGKVEPIFWNIERVDRETKMTGWKNGLYPAVQVYSTTEVVEFDAQPGSSGIFKSLRALGGNVGYGQVAFAPEGMLEEHGGLVKDWLFDISSKWNGCIIDPEKQAVLLRENAESESNFQGQQDHFNRESVERTTEMLRRTSRLASATRSGPLLGVMDEKKFKDAMTYLGDTNGGSSLWSSFHQPPVSLMVGDHLARSLLGSVKDKARQVWNRTGTRPSLAVITVGEEAVGGTHPTAEEREKRRRGESWFNKEETGRKHGIKVKTINLPEQTTTDEVISALNSVRRYDGVQLMWPLPDHIDSRKAYLSIPHSKDCDGVYYMGLSELASSDEGVTLPVTCEAVMMLLDEYNVDIDGAKVLVIGRSRIVGRPLAYALDQRNATVTTAHSKTFNLKGFVADTDIVISCVGSPSLIAPEWVKSGSTVVNVGTVFEDSKLFPDVHPSNLGSFGSSKLHSSTPGGVGPLSVAVLMKNVADMGMARMHKEMSRPKGATIQTPILPNTSSAPEKWSLSPSSGLVRVFRLESFAASKKFVSDCIDVGCEINHHPNFTTLHHCVDGVDVEVRWATQCHSGELTELDIEACALTDKAWREGGWEIVEDEGDDTPFDDDEDDNNTDNNDEKSSSFHYTLPQERIAEFPASPRGSSKFLHRGPDGSLKSHERFDEAFGPMWKERLVDQYHVVFNDSRVIRARCWVTHLKGEARSVEMLLLSPSSSDPTTALMSKATDQKWKCMLRANCSVGDVFSISGGIAEVVKVLDGWAEEGEGDGTECIVKLRLDSSSSTMLMGEFLESVGEIPIPPYIERRVKKEDEIGYQNVYSKQEGSVAAPTAGLHFTDSLMDIVSNSSSFLTLHVGAGTFKPIVAARISEHQMHGEPFSVDSREVMGMVRAIEDGKGVLSVGTTSGRTLESLYWLAVKGMKRGGGDSSYYGHLGQWECYELAREFGDDLPPRCKALRWLCERSGGKIEGETKLMIKPGYRFQVVDALITNFHAPDSTLMCMVGGFLGKAEVRRCYDKALNEDFRFLSYGDVCLFERK